MFFCWVFPSFSPERLHWFLFPPAMCKSDCSPTVSLTCCPAFLTLVDVVGEKWYLGIVLICVCLIVRSFDSSCVSGSFYIFFLWIICPYLFSQFSIEFLALCPLIFKSSVYIWDIIHLSLVYAVNTLSQFVSCLLIYLICILWCVCHTQEILM